MRTPICSSWTTGQDRTANSGGQSGSQAGTASSVTDREGRVALGEPPCTHLPRPPHASVPCTRLSPRPLSQPRELPVTHVPVTPGGGAILPGILSKAEPRQPSPPRPLPSLPSEPRACRSRERMSLWHIATLLRICPKHIGSDLLYTTPGRKGGPAGLLPPGPPPPGTGV